MFKRQDSITIQTTSLTGESFLSMQGMGEATRGGFSLLFPFHSGLWEKMSHGLVSTVQWPPPSARGLSCQDNCCQDMLLFLGNHFRVLFLHSKPSPLSIVTPTWEAIRVLTPCGDWERAAREDKSSYQRGICDPRGICTNSVVYQTIHALWKQRSQSPELGASSSHEIKINSQACNTFKKYLVWNRIKPLGIFCTVISSYISSCDWVQWLWSASAYAGSSRYHHLTQPGKCFFLMTDMSSKDHSFPLWTHCLWVLYHQKHCLSFTLLVVRAQQ